MALYDFVDWKYPESRAGIHVPTAVCSHGCSASSCSPSCSTSCGGSACGMDCLIQKTHFGGKSHKNG